MLTIVLLAVMPTLGRLCAGQHGSQEAAGKAAMVAAAISASASMSMMPGIAMPHAPAWVASQQPTPACTDHDGCANCGLLNTMAGLALLLVLLLPQGAPVFARRAYRQPRTATLHPCGLGSR